MHAPIYRHPRHSVNGTRYSLHYGGSNRPLATVIPDQCWPKMFRIRWPDGRLSDMANLARAKDAAFEMVQRGLSNRNGKETLHWRTTASGEATGTLLARFDGDPGPHKGRAS